MRIEKSISSLTTLFCCALTMLATIALPACAEKAEKEEAAGKANAGTISAELREKMKPFASLMGGWRGVALPKRGSNRGAWSEKSDWAWEFGKTPGLRYSVTRGKLMESALLTWDAKNKHYLLDLKIDAKTNRKYTGTFKDTKLTLTSSADAEGNTHRLTVTMLNEKRTLVLHEAKQKGRNIFLRVAEVGYTRAGTSIAGRGGSGPECIVTGGKGTMTVSYKGETYYVCCTGCKQAFEENPAQIIADAEARWAKEKAEAKK